MKLAVRRRAIPRTPVLRTLIDDLLAEQQSLLTPVARFAEEHDREPDLAGHYRNLIPLSAPGPGEQYAFEVSLDRCTSCKACVAACHSLNGLDDDEAWRDVGLLTGGVEEPGWQQTVTTSCHHCADPGCLTGCPVGAYEKDSTTGIVKHLDDQCIGCSYCILKCAFDVPKFSKKRGIVRKCDMCQGRLAAGEAPACVQACPTKAIRIVKRNVAEVIAEGRAGKGFLTGAPSPRSTLPSTLYLGRAVPSTARPADQEALVPQHTHWPLAIMLSLTQAGLGLVIAAAFSASQMVAIAGALVFLTGMAASILHLGRPLGAWRFFLGLRTSWLSREILAFSLIAPLVMSVPALPFIGIWIPAVLLSGLPVALSIMAVIAVFTSVMIYVDTHRTTWRFAITGPRFFGTMLVFTAMGFALSTESLAVHVMASLLILARLLPEACYLRKGKTCDEESKWTADRHMALLLRGPLRAIMGLRFILAVCSALLLPAMPWPGFALLLIAELCERVLFFKSVHAPKMPGNFSAARH